MPQQRGLGRGFDSLIPSAPEPEFDPTPDSQSRIELVNPELIDPNPHQPRTTFKQTELDALAQSIKEHGILQPLVAQKRGERYELIAGERRLRAAKSIKLNEVPVIIRSFDEQESLELALIENIQREQLNPVETATAYQKLLTQFNLGPKDIATRVGKDQSTIKNTIRLLKLPLEAKRALAEGKISEGHARAILSAPEQQQEELLASILERDWTVRHAEEFARAAKSSRVSPTQVTSENNLTKQLSQKIDAPVQLQHRAKGGRLLIHYKDDDDLARLVDMLSR